MKINVLEAKNRLSALIEAARSGQEVIIAKRGVPVARLVPIEPPAAPRPGSGAALLRWLDAHPLPPGSRRSREQIEAAIAERRASWD